jgi:hypothetical protein
VLQIKQADQGILIEPVSDEPHVVVKNGGLVFSGTGDRKVKVQFEEMTATSVLNQVMDKVP